MAEPAGRTDLELINLIKEENDEDALKELSERHGAIYSSVINRYVGNNYQNSGQANIELLQDKNLMIYNCARNYDENKVCKFTGYLWNSSRYHILNNLNDKYNKNTYSVEPEKINLLVDGQIKSEINIKDYSDVDFILETASKMDDPRIYKIIKSRFFKGENGKLNKWKNVGKDVGISSQQCINLYLRSIKYLRNKVKANG